MAQNKMTIRKGDTVKVIAGKDKGVVGEIIAVSDGSTVTMTAASNETPSADAASQPTGSYGYVGNSSSKVVHLAGCGKLPGESNRVYFASLDEALAAGYRKHANCLGN